VFRVAILAGSDGVNFDSHAVPKANRIPQAVAGQFLRPIFAETVTKTGK